MSEVEKDFDAVVAQINAKLQEAANALAEANRLSGTVGIVALINSQYVRDEMRADEYNKFIEKIKNIKVGALEAELDDAGWSTSSAYC